MWHICGKLKSSDSLTRVALTLPRNARHFVFSEASIGTTSFFHDLPNALFSHRSGESKIWTQLQDADIIVSVNSSLALAASAVSPSLQAVVSFPHSQLEMFDRGDVIRVAENGEFISKFS